MRTHSRQAEHLPSMRACLSGSHRGRLFGRLHSLQSAPKIKEKSSWQFCPTREKDRHGRKISFNSHVFRIRGTKNDYQQQCKVQYCLYRSRRNWLRQHCCALLRPLYVLCCEHRRQLRGINEINPEPSVCICSAGGIFMPERR